MENEGKITKFGDQIHQKIKSYINTVAYSIFTSVIVINVYSSISESPWQSSIVIADLIIGRTLTWFVATVFAILGTCTFMFIYDRMGASHRLSRAMLCLCLINDIVSRIMLAVTTSSLTAYLNLVRPTSGVSLVFPIVISCFYVLFGVYLGKIKSVTSDVLQ